MDILVLLGIFQQDMQVKKKPNTKLSLSEVCRKFVGSLSVVCRSLSGFSLSLSKFVVFLSQFVGVCLNLSFFCLKLSVFVSVSGC